MRPSAFPPRGICRSWRVIGGNDTTFPRPKQAGILKIEVLRAGGNANAQEVICRGNCFSCFRCWEVRSFGDWEKTSKKTPKLQASLSPSSESKEVLSNCLLCLIQADGSAGRLAPPCDRAGFARREVIGLPEGEARAAKRSQEAERGPPEAASVAVRDAGRHGYFTLFS